MKLTVQDFNQMGVKTYLAKRFLPYFNKYLDQFGVNTPNRLIGFLSNLLQETAYFYYVEEIASGAAYENRIDLGNVHKGDGRKFKGRGLGQVTGRSNYYAFTKFCKSMGIDIDFVKNPERLKEPQFAVLSAFWFWSHNRLERYADKGQFQKCWAVWNTGRANRHFNRINGARERVNAAVKVKNWIKKLIKEYED